MLHKTKFVLVYHRAMWLSVRVEIGRSLVPDSLKLCVVFLSRKLLSPA